jgi:hypothetical protein
MIYLYHCENCKKYIDIIKSADDYKRNEFCECGAPLSRIFCPPVLKITKTDWPEYNPAFGKVMTRDEVKYEVKKRDLIEIGNEDINKIDAKLEKDAKKERAAGWDNLVNQVYKEI